ncbi:hypothetical protein DND47_16560 [Pseudomonas syringae pv. syringae]|nr:hypothetical protein DND47_16560 [Pseudomonas syringae pv. syringae]
MVIKPLASLRRKLRIFSSAEHSTGNQGPVGEIVMAGKKVPMPEGISPQLVSMVTKPPAGIWHWETKAGWLSLPCTD